MLPRVQSSSSAPGLTGAGREQSSLLTHSDCDLATQQRSRGATWLDKQLIASEPLPLGPGFGSEVEVAKTRRLEYLESEGLAQRRGDRFALSRNLLGTLRERDLADAGAALSREHGLPYRQSRSSGEVSGVLSPAHRARFGTVCDDRRWPWVFASPLVKAARPASGAICERPASIWWWHRMDTGPKQVDRDMMGQADRYQPNLDNRTT